MDRRWVQRLIDEEQLPALLLLLAAMAGLFYANVLGGHVPNLDIVLVVFFFVAGLELRHELTKGALTEVRSALIPVFAAAFGMLVPALLYLALAPADARDAWGVPMATDLPLALAVLAVLGRGLPIEFRAFILTLAIVDDVLSIVVVAIHFGSNLAAGWLLLVAVCVLGYARIPRAIPQFAFALIAVWAMTKTGVHVTVLGVVLGLVTSRDVDAIRDRWQPVSAYAAVPLFIFSALAVKMSVVNGPLVTAITAARVIGKPVGILLGAAIAIALLRPSSRLGWHAYAVAGSIGGIGFSVSMLFAELSLNEELLAETELAVVIALVIAAVAAAGALRTMRRPPVHG